MGNVQQSDFNLGTAKPDSSNSLIIAPEMQQGVEEIVDAARRVFRLGYQIGCDALGAEGANGTEAKAFRVARLAIKRRRKRDRLIGSDFFSDPIWNILLDLYVAHADGHSVSVSSACIAAGVPLSSAIRCCKQMEASGLACRERDPTDGRRVFLKLTGDCRRKMTSILSDSEASIDICQIHEISTAEPSNSDCKMPRAGTADA